MSANRPGATPPGSLSTARYVEMRQRRDDAHDVGLWLGGTNAPADVLAAQERVVAALDVASGVDLDAVRKVVERYGRMWAKDTDYYRAAEVLGIEPEYQPLGDGDPNEGLADEFDSGVGGPSHQESSQGAHGNG